MILLLADDPPQLHDYAIILIRITGLIKTHIIALKYLLVWNKNETGEEPGVRKNLAIYHV
jgi:hypothetical protein